MDPAEAPLDIRGMRQQHHGDPLGYCRTCVSIWPCPTLRTKFRALWLQGAVESGIELRVLDERSA